MGRGLPTNDATWTREDVSFDSEGSRCAAWFYAPSSAANEGERACVVLAHGFAGLKEMRLGAFAERFAAAGHAALVFDYRGFGESEGEPRQLLDMGMQAVDWSSAIAYARSRPEVDPARIVLWGTSLSGGHVLELALRTPDIAAVISQVPHLDGMETALATPAWTRLRLFFVAAWDWLLGVFGRPPIYLPTVGAPGTLAVMTAPGEAEGMRRLYPPEGIREEVAARSLLQVALYSPGWRSRSLSIPWLVQVAENDLTIPPAPTLEAAEAAPLAELRTYPMGHFDVYVEPTFDSIVGDQIGFLRRHLPGSQEASD